MLSFLHSTDTKTFSSKGSFSDYFVHSQSSLAGFTDVHSTIVCNRNNAQRWGPTKSGQEPGLKGMGSGKFEGCLCPPPPTTQTLVVIIIKKFEFKWFYQGWDLRNQDPNKYTHAENDRTPPPSLVLGSVDEFNMNIAKNRGRETCVVKFSMAAWSGFPVLTTTWWIISPGDSLKSCTTMSNVSWTV